ncbi:hypothetical protein Bca101_043761 [Brassica carinata]
MNQTEAIDEGDSTSIDTHQGQLERRPVLERISPPVARNLLPDGDDQLFPEEPTSQERVPALQRQTPPTGERIPLLRNGAANSDSGLLQEVELQYMEEIFPAHIISGSGGPSSSRLPAKERLTLPQESPIRSLSSDRRHVATCIISNPPEDGDHPGVETQLRIQPARAKKTINAKAAKAAGKRKAPDEPQAKKRTARNPLQGVSLKKHRINKIQNSPRCKDTARTPSPKQNIPAPAPPTGAQQRPNPPSTSFLLGPDKRRIFGPEKALFLSLNGLELSGDQKHPYSPPTEANRNMVVADLTDAQYADWNVEAIRQHLPQYEGLIRAIPLSQFAMEDEVVWLPNKMGSYSTKTGYALIKINAADPYLDFNLKKLVWGVKTSPKLKHFLWKIKNKALPVGENLLRRGIEVEVHCKRCGTLETDRHLFSQCSFATRVWELFPAALKPIPSSISTPASPLIACNRMVNLPPTGLSATDLFPWVLWYLWTARNKLLFENLVLSEQDVATLAIKEARTWQAAQPVTEKTSSVPIPSNLPRACGNVQTVECFVDAAWNATTRGGGFGCIFKDPFNKRIFHQKSANRCFFGSAFIA